MKLELGCGGFPREGFQGIDIYPAYPGCIVMDLEIGIDSLGFANIEEIWADNVLEHITNLIVLMNSCHRACAPGGRFHIKVPLANTVGSLKDPTHVRQFIPESFDYFDQNWDYERQPNYGILKWIVEKIEVDPIGPYTQMYVVLRKP